MKTDETVIVYGPGLTLRAAHTEYFLNELGEVVLRVMMSHHEKGSYCKSTRMCKV